MAKKEGQYFIIDKIDNVRLIEVIFKGEESRPLYKIYDGKECVDKWRSDEDLHSMADYEVMDAADYQIFLDYVDDNYEDENLEKEEHEVSRIILNKNDYNPKNSTSRANSMEIFTTKNLEVISKEEMSLTSKDGSINIKAKSPGL